MNVDNFIDELSKFNIVEVLNDVTNPITKTRIYHVKISDRITLKFNLSQYDRIVNGYYHGTVFARITAKDQQTAMTMCKEMEFTEDNIMQLRIILNRIITRVTI